MSEFAEAAGEAPMRYEGPVSTFRRFERDESRDFFWREVRFRFRRGARRVVRGPALFARGLGDLFVTSLPMLAFALVFALIWLSRRVFLVRLALVALFSSIVFAHRVVSAVSRTVRDLAARHLLAGSILFLLLSGCVASTAMLEVAVALAQSLLGWLGLGDLFRLPLPGVVLGGVVNEAAHLARVGIERFLYASAVLAGALATGLVIGLTGLSIGALLWSLAKASSWLVLRLVDLVGAAIGFFMTAVVVVITTPFDLAIRAVRLVASIPLALLSGLWRALAYLARGLRSTLTPAPRASSARGGAAARSRAAPRRSTDRQFSAAFQAISRFPALFLKALVGMAVALVSRLLRTVSGLARFVWRRVFRLFALSGALAFLALAYWALRAAEKGRPFPLADAQTLAALVTAGTAALLAVSGAALLVAIGFAIRAMPARAVRTAGLISLVALAIAPVPLLWRTPWAQTARDVAAERAGDWAQDGGAMLVQAAPYALASVVGVLAVWAAALAGLALARLAASVPARVYARVGVAVALLVSLLATGWASMSAWRSPAVTEARAELANRSAEALVWLASLRLPQLDIDLWPAEFALWKATVPPSTPVSAPVSASSPDSAPATNPDAPPASDPATTAATASAPILLVRVPAHTWRLGSASEIVAADGAPGPLATLEPAIPFEEWCDLQAIVAVGSASSDGPRALNLRLSACRADALARHAHTVTHACAPAPQIWVADLGESAVTPPTARERQALLLATTVDADALGQALAAGAALLGDALGRDESDPALDLRAKGLAPWSAAAQPDSLCR